jgi:SAM-dependent methyltransferase
VTVVDLSRSMLQLDEREAQRRNVVVRTIEGAMDNLSMLGESTFDLVHQPVSTCYVPRLAPVFREIARVLRPGGLYVSQHKQPTSLQVTHRDAKDRYVLGLEYSYCEPLPHVPDRSYREPGAVEYLHPWEELVGELCRVGFVIEDLVEPDRSDRDAPPGHFAHRGRYVAPYVRLKARRRSREVGPDVAKIILSR